MNLGDKMKKFVVFDVDGTLLDTIETITFHVNKTIEKLGLEAVTSDFTAGILGYSSVYLIEKTLEFRGYEYTEEKLDEILDYYHRSYQSKVSYLTKAYEGILDLLVYLKGEGYGLASISNKPDHTLSVLYEEIDFNKYFDFVLGQVDDIAKKPNPDMVYRLMDEFNLEKEDLVFVGDTEVDYETAKNAGVDFIAVTWGFRTKEELAKLKPEYMVDTVSELKDTIKEGLK